MEVKHASWKPFTRSYKNILQYPGYDQSSSWGLGYDSALDDCKIVMISKVYPSKDHFCSFPDWVFGLKSDSWRKIQDAALSFLVVYSVEKDNLSHWLVASQMVLCIGNLMI
ncbi:hypothetical protein SLE2022_134040 [Rubroshorea leprosula]